MTMSGPPNIAERYAYFDGGSTMYLVKSYKTGIQYSLSHWAVMHEARYQRLQSLVGAHSHRLHGAYLAANRGANANVCAHDPARVL
jgi:hypothetical protein